MSGLKREDELKMKEYERVEAAGRVCDLSEEDLMHYSLLRDRYDNFIEEGMRKMREAAPTSSTRLDAPKNFKGLFAKLSPRRKPIEGSFGSVGSDRTDGGALKSPVLASNCSLDITPMDLDGVACSGRHWSWVTEQIIVGAIPFAAQTRDTPGHLSELGNQCLQRKVQIVGVVSCLEFDEFVSTPGFAGAREWETQLNVTTFITAPLPRSGDVSIPKTTLDEMISVCAQVRQLLSVESSCPAASLSTTNGAMRRLSLAKPPEKRKAVYVHCKAGKQRSWVVAMCYLISQHQRSFDEADALCRGRRSSFAPTDAQIAFVQSFAEYVTQPRLSKERNDDEEKYQMVLADVLSLPTKLRLRLISDLEKLT